MAVATFSLASTVDLPDYSTSTSAFDISSHIQSVLDAGVLVLGSPEEQAISSIISTIFGGMNVIAQSLPEVNPIDRGNARARHFYITLSRWIELIAAQLLEPDVVGDSNLDNFMVTKLQELNTQGLLNERNNEWIFTADLIDNTLTQTGLAEGSSDFSASITLTPGVTQAVGHTHPVSNAVNDPLVASELKDFFKDFETVCRELPGAGDHVVTISNDVPNYFITPTGIVRVVEIVNNTIRVRTIGGVDFPGDLIDTSNYSEAASIIGNGVYNIPAQQMFRAGSVPPCNKPLSIQ